MNVNDKEMNNIEAYHKIIEIYNKVRTTPDGVNKFYIYKEALNEVCEIAQEFMCYGMISSFLVREVVDMFLSLEKTMMEDRAKYLSERYNELPVGTVVELPFGKIVVAENENSFHCCNECYLISNCKGDSSNTEFGACEKDYRTDMKNVIFELKNTK